MSEIGTPLFNELAQYFESSPNTLVAGCMNTHEHTDGVVFPGIEPQEDTHCFVGRESIVSAMAVLHDMTPDDVLDRLSLDADDQTAYIKELERELRSLRTKFSKLEKILGIAD